MRRTWTVALMMAALTVRGGFCAEPRRLSELVNALRSEDSYERYAAVDALYWLGLDAAPAIPQLIRALEDPDESVREGAANALREIGPEAAQAIPKLIERLGESEAPWFVTDAPTTDVGFAAASALGRMGRAAVGPLVRCLDHPSPVVRFLAAYALGKIGPDAEPAAVALAEMFDDEEEAVRMEAIWATAKITPRARSAVRRIIERLEDEETCVRVAAVDALGSIRPTTPGIVERLTHALGDEDGLVQAHAANALGDLGAKAAPAVTALANTLTSREGYPYPDGHPYSREPVAGTAARALGRIGRPAKATMPLLLDTIRNTDGTFDEYGSPTDNREVRAEAAKAAARIDPDNQELLDVLERSLRNDSAVREDVALALGMIGPKAKRALPALVDVIGDGYSSERFSCACAVLRIDTGNSLAIDTLLAELAPPYLPGDEETWDALISALKQAGADSRRAIPRLIELLNSASADRENAARALAQFGPEARIAIPALLDLLDEPYDGVRREAIAALQRISSGEVPLLEAALKEPNPQIRCGVVEVLGHFPSAAPLLTDALNDPSARVRLAALSALGQLDARAKAAIPRVKGLVEDDSLTVREAAREVLMRLGESDVPDR
jgi:HEAT repeat protein